MTSIAQERAGLAAVGWRLRTREQWGARRSYTDARAVTEPANRVFVHISVTNPSSYVSDDAHARAIENIGINRFPATGISYNRLIMRSGTAYEGQPIGRRGAHTGSYSGNCTESGCPNRGGNVSSANHNVAGRGYVICQNVGDPVTDAQFDALARSIAADMLAGFVLRTAPIHGHRCVSDKSCPGPLMWARMGALEILVRHYLRVGLGATEEDDMNLTDELSLSTSTQNLIDASTVSVDNALENGLIAGVLLTENLATILSELDAIKAAVAAAPPGSTVVSGFTDEALKALGVAVADEQHRRLQA